MGSWHYISTEEHRRMVAQYERGLLPGDIAENTGRQVRTVITQLRVVGYQFPLRDDDIDVCAVIESYEAGLSLTECAKKYHTNHIMVRNIVNAAGKLRPPVAMSRRRQ